MAQISDLGYAFKDDDDAHRVLTGPLSDFVREIGNLLNQTYSTSLSPGDMLQKADEWVSLLTQREVAELQNKLTGLSQKNAVRLEKDGAFAFLEKSEMELDKGCERFLSAVAKIVRSLNLQVPGMVVAEK